MQNATASEWARIILYIAGVVVGLFIIVYAVLPVETDWALIGLGLAMAGMGGTATAFVPPVQASWSSTGGGKYGA